MSVETGQIVAAVNAGDTETVRGLVAADPALAGARDAQGVSIRLLARYRNDRATSEVLRSAAVPLDVFEAAAFDEAERLAALLSTDPALARAWNGDGFTPLHLAAFFGGADGGRLLLDAGADPDAVARNAMKVAPIHSAAAGRRSVALLLVERGADVRVPQRHGWTPLHTAADHGDLELVEALLKAGADPAATNDDGVSPADLAEQKGHDAVAKRIRDAATG